MFQPGHSWWGRPLLSFCSFQMLCWHCTSCPVYWLPLAVLHRCLPLCGFVWDCGSSVEFCPVRLPTRLFPIFVMLHCISSCLGIPNDPQWHTPSENPVRHCKNGKKWGRTIGHTRNLNIENNSSEKSISTLSTTVVHTQKWSARRKGPEYVHVMVHKYLRKCKIDFTILTYWLTYGPRKAVAEVSNRNEPIGRNLEFNWFERFESQWASHSVVLFWTD